MSLLLVFWSVTVYGQEETEEDGFIHRDFQFTFMVPPVGTNGMEFARVVNCFSINTFAGFSAGTECMELGGFLNINKAHMRGSQIADWFFVVFHTSLTLFNALGWIWKATRKLNLITLVLTGASWFLLGLFYGIGYCPLTDWHFQILRRLDGHDLPSSYLKYLVERLTPFDPSSSLVDTTTAIVFFVALALSLVLNIRDRRKKGAFTGFPR